VLNVLGVWWGLPGHWAPIELLPEYVVDALSHHFSNGWFDAYPPLQYYVLAIVTSPFLLLSRIGRVPFDRVYTFVVLLYRLVSVAAAAGTVAAVCAAGTRAFGRREGLWAAGFMALTTPFVYYAKTANVDVPYLFWFALSLVWYLRVLQGGTIREYMWFAVCATCSVCTKDQAYGLYVVMPIPIVVEIWSANRRSGDPRALLHAVTDRRIWIAALTSAVLFVTIHNIVFNLEGFRQHLAFLTGSGSVPFRVFEPTFAGRLQLLQLTLDLTEQALGWPFTAAIVCGMAIAISRPASRRVSIWLLLPIVSYYLTFIDVIVYNYDRFMLPVCLILALFGGVAMEALMASRVVRDSRSWRDWRSWRVGLAAGVFAYTLLYTGAVDYLMIRDARYHVERWLRTTIGAGQVVGTSGQREYIPTLDGFAHTDVPDLASLASVHPAYMLFNADYARAVPRDSDWGRLIAGLQHGTAGYQLVGTFREALPWGWLPGMHRDLTGPRRERVVFTTLRNINPTIEVFAPVAR
jgi:4-amino-4-deoxy-L-arabinose transferase-like glycosyltransferase